MSSETPRGTGSTNMGSPDKMEVSELLSPGSSAQIPTETAYELVPPGKPRWFRIRLERWLLGLVLALALALTAARYIEGDRISEIDQALSWVVEVQKAQIGVLKATRDSLVANDMQLLEMMRFHGRFHAEQDRKPEIRPESP